MEENAAVHVPVMAEEALHWLALRPHGVYVDGTAGGGGHSEAIARQLEGGRLIALDRDLEAVARVRQRLAAYPCATVYPSNYGEMASALAACGVEAVDGVLIDAGLSSVQLDDPARGFSFQVDGPLDMRMDRDSGMTARDFLRSATEAELAAVLRNFGDVGPAKRIAHAIARRCGEGRMERTGDLVAAVCEALDFVSGVPEETRTVFQAVRMAVNGELMWLERGLQAAVAALKPGGRLVVISFHSGEDRVVKNVLRDASRPARLLRPDGRQRAVTPARLRLLTPKPVLPSAEEQYLNPRAKSAKLRAAERLDDGSGAWDGMDR